MIKVFARFGFFSRAIVYFLMGGLAFLVALGERHGEATDSKGILRTLLEQPFGSVILVVLAAGLASYAVWRTFQAFTGRGIDDHAMKGKLLRAGYLLSALAHFSLGFYALNLIYFFSSSPGKNEKTIAHELLTLPFGRLITGVVAIGIIWFGCYQFVKAFKEKFLRSMAIPAARKRIIIPICKFGLSARGFVFALIGFFFLQAAARISSSEAGGITDAWKVLADQPYGNTLVGVVAAGFMAFGVYGITEALYEQVA